MNGEENTPAGNTPPGCGRPCARGSGGLTVRVPHQVYPWAMSPTGSPLASSSPCWGWWSWISVLTPRRGPSEPTCWTSWTVRSRTWPLISTPSLPVRVPPTPDRAGEAALRASASGQAGPPRPACHSTSGARSWGPVTVGRAVGAGLASWPLCCPLPVGGQLSHLRGVPPSRALVG